MRILDKDSGNKLDNVILYFTEMEIKKLIDFANGLLGKKSADHCHLSNKDYTKEITICIYDPENIEMFDERSKKLILEDK